MLSLFVPRLLSAAVFSFVPSAANTTCVPLCTNFVDAAFVEGTLATVPCGQCVSLKSGTRLARLEGLQVDGVLRVEENVTISTHYVLVRASPDP